MPLWKQPPHRSTSHPKGCPGPRIVGWVHPRMQTLPLAWGRFFLSDLYTCRPISYHSPRTISAPSPQPRAVEFSTEERYPPPACHGPSQRPRLYNLGGRQTKPTASMSTHHRASSTLACRRGWESRDRRSPQARV